jgi:gamma-polyglutamate synthase
MNNLTDDLFSKGALGSFFSTLILITFLLVWKYWTSKINKRLEAIPLRILVTGTRGKSSTVRIIHSMLINAGYKPYGKTTGTAAAEFTTLGVESKTWRFGSVSVLEMFESVNRATRKNGDLPDALVMECMAVSPNLIELLAREIFKPNITIITNALLDHLEEEGSNKYEIAKSLAKAIPGSNLVITSEKNLDLVNLFTQIAKEHNSVLVQARPENLEPNTLQQVKGVYPDNAAIALKLGQHLKIPEEKIIEAIQKASREPGEKMIFQRFLNDLQITYVDIGAVNDADSFHSALQDFLDYKQPDTPMVALLVGRWDRPLRALQFAGLLSHQIFDGVMIAGEPSFQVKKILLAEGWQTEKISRLNLLCSSHKYWLLQVKSLVKRINPEARKVFVVSIENIHDPVADSVRKYFSDGLLISDGRIYE